MSLLRVSQKKSVQRRFEKRLRSFFLVVIAIFSLSSCGYSAKDEDAALDVIDYNALDLEELSKLAKDDDAEAAYRLGKVYDYGLMNQATSFKEAFYWYKKASDSGNMYATNALGYLYLNGCGTEVSVDDARECFSQASEAGITNGYVGLARCELLDLSLAGASRRAFDYISQALEDENCLDALYYMGYLKETGIGTARNYKKALEYYSSVSDSDSEEVEDQFAIDDSKTRMAIMYIKGLGVESDYDLAFDLLKDAADNNYSKAIFYQGVIEEIGFGSKPDYQDAIEYYEKAANMDYAPALNQLGCMYAKGKGVDVDYERSFYYQSLAAAQGYTPAQINLGYLYENGLGTDVDLEAAKSYYWMAKESGYNGATSGYNRVNNLINDLNREDE